MELREAAQYIRDTVSMQTVLDLYGYTWIRAGFMRCPFHGERTASFKVYPGTKGWHCFGCGRGGSVIDFVMEHDGCDFPTAVKALDRALGLDLLRPGDPLDTDRQRQISRILDDFAALLMEMIGDREREIEIWLRISTAKQMELESIPKRERTAREWTELENLIEGMKYAEYQKELCEEKREEVRLWLREMRRKRGRGKAK